MQVLQRKVSKQSILNDLDTRINKSELSIREEQFPGGHSKTMKSQASVATLENLRGLDANLAPKEYYPYQRSDKMTEDKNV